MEKGRLEAFSDGVFAIIITIMVLELKVPVKADLASLLALWPVFLGYVLSFVYVGIYWNNHHHMFQVAKSINGTVMWANMNLLFWLSLVPFVTDWMGQNQFAKLPVTCYGLVLLMNALSYTVLLFALIRNDGKDSVLAKAVRNDAKGKISTIIYIVGIGLSSFCPTISVILYGSVACIWFIPDKRIEREITGEEGC
jgi:uncharacterized membrane protein